ncbi:hypothetical protein [Rhizobium chutanense]|nr:hypothetical protein [Rhizobium chutanense]
MAVLVAVLAPGQASAQVDDEQSILERQAFALIRKGDCAEAWRVIWRQARRGDSEALASLVNKAIPFAGLVPPSYFPMTENLVQHLEDQMIALSLYAWKNSEVGDGLKGHGIGLRDRLARTFANEGVANDYKRVDACLKSNKSNGECVQLAIKLKVIPSFDAYVSMMDLAPREAFCIHLPERSTRMPQMKPLESQQR